MLLQLPRKGIQNEVFGLTFELILTLRGFFLDFKLGGYF